MSATLLALGLALLAPRQVHAQWLGLPDPPDPDEPEFAETDPFRATEARSATVERSATPSRSRPRGPRHELTLGVLPSFNAHVVRRATAPGAEYRIKLAVRELSVQGAWSVFGRRALGVRWAIGVGVGKPVVVLTRPLEGFSLFDPGPFRLRGPTLSVDAALGLLVRIGPVRFGPQVSYTETRLRRASGQTIDEDVPYTTPTHLHRAGFGLLLQVLPHPNVGLALETRVLAAPHRIGGQLRVGFFAAWSGGGPAGRP